MNQRELSRKTWLRQMAGGRGPRRKELANIVNNHVDLLFCMLTAGAFALAVARSIALWSG